MKSSSVLIVGCGDLGIRAGTLLARQGWSVTGVRRNIQALPAEIVGRAADYTHAGSLAFAQALRPDFVVAVFNPAGRSVAGYEAGFQGGMRHLLAGLGQHRPRHVLMTSSTRVFAEQQGGWVDESSAVTSDDAAALAMLAAERALLESGHNASVVRFAGIYGNPENRLIARICRGERSPPEPVSYTNRMHREDCAAFLVHLLLQADAGQTLQPLYIGVDDAPAPRYEVESWLAGQLGVLDRVDSVAAEQMAPFPGGGHKRCRNLALQQSGYQLRYPDYRSGYAALLALR
jgi:nucleoside-diphosphate-sugar epimerase